MEDAPGESGFPTGGSANPDTVVALDLYWRTGDTATGSRKNWK